MNKQRLLFTPFLLGSLKLPNHIVMAPLTRSRANDEGIPSSFAAKYYSERAAAGLIISEGTNISSQARGFALHPASGTRPRSRHGSRSLRPFIKPAVRSICSSGIPVEYPTRRYTAELFRLPLPL